MQSRAYLVEECRHCAEVETEFRGWSEFITAQVSESQSVSVEREKQRLTKNEAKLDVTKINCELEKQVSKEKSKSLYESPKRGVLVS